MRTTWLGLVTLVLLAAGTLAAHAQPFRPAASRCWQPPGPQTVQEAVVVAQNPLPGGSLPPGTLALSDGRLKAAYAAGLVVGWGETGRRPEFLVVTAVGMSALIAPFAFLGASGDAVIADVFACGAGTAKEMAHRAADRIDAAMLERIARKHENGGRLLVALPGSAARFETIWDLGAIAASRDARAHEHIAAILAAAVDHTTFVDPKALPLTAGWIVKRNPALRAKGAGEAFLPAVAPGDRRRGATYLVHNGVLFPDEGDEYAAAQLAQPVAMPSEMRLLPAHDYFLTGRNGASEIHIASPRPYLSFEQRSAFDPSYMRALFVDTYRQGRMHREWRTTFVDRNAGRTYGR
jgi:hypothetical protein